ncbi:MAG: ribosome biogenesis GTPase Der [Erysipelotrichia bacterium]|jgi:GTP-binding protein|nr:ribosome biogenesis GTPase Der [Bacilli bacterium]NMV82623.1 ribosome biogenesis GTPase Der [Erysipelotrichia bacterium]
MPMGIVAIIGSPNVGKSTIFNRIIGTRRSIIDDQPGITRDRLYASASWLTKEFRVIDTGGIEIAARPFQEQIRAQAQIAIEEADVIVYVVDGQVGVTNDDREIAKLLYKSNKHIILVVNKIDDITKIADIYEFTSLGLGEPIAVSGAHGIGIGDLLDRIVKLLPDGQANKFDEDEIVFSIIGRPNVGKSSLSNAILGTNRVIVSEIEGTTRDAIDTKFVRDDKNYVVIDTAGLKKRGRIYEAIDKYAALRALAAIDRSEIVMLVIDAQQGITEQDKHVVGYAMELDKAIILVVNKWDLIPRSQTAMSEFTKEVRKQFKFLEYAPIVFVSAKDKARIDSIFKALDMVNEAYGRRIQTSVLNEIIQDAQVMNPAPFFEGGRLKIFFANQVDIRPPTFVLFVNQPKHAHFSYMRYIENRLRESFSFDGTPIKIVLRARK